MAIFPKTLLLLIILVFIVGFIILGLRKSNSGIKVMLLGLNLTLFGGLFAVDPNSSLGGIEFFIALLGLIISIIGLIKEN